MIQMPGRWSDQEDWNYRSWRNDMDVRNAKRMLRSFILCVLVSSSLLVCSDQCKIPVKAAEDGAIVQMSYTYTYENMMQDILLFQQNYPGILSAQPIGTSCLGRCIPEIVLGNPNAPHQVMVQATIHAREYLSTQMTMRMIEYYASQYYTGSLNGVLYSDLFNNTCFHIVPMANPDGVAVAQYGSGSTADLNTYNFLNAVGHWSSWKANACGVDLNRNFDVGWASINQGVYAPSYENYKGIAPSSEPETQALMALATARNYDAFISYHMQGNLIYYDEPGNLPQVSSGSAALASVAAAYTGYTPRNLKSCISSSGSVVQGGFNDWVQLALQRPGITIEVGTGLPPQAQGQVATIFSQNKDTWAAIACLFVGV